MFGPLGNCHWTELAHQGTRWRVLRHNASASGGAPGLPRRSGADGAPDVAEAAGVAEAAPAASRGGEPVRAGAVPDEAPPAPTDADALS